MILLFDIGNTHTHLGLADGRRVIKRADISTLAWFGGGASALVRKFTGKHPVDGAVMCSVVPRVTPLARRAVRRLWKVETLEVNARTVRGVGID